MFPHLRATFGATAMRKSVTKTEPIENCIAFWDPALDRGAQPLSDEVADHSNQRHAECHETRYQHCGTRDQGEYRHPVERLVNEARHDPLILSS